MKSIWIYTDAAGSSRFKPLPLTIPHLGDPAALAGPGEAKRKQLIPSTGLRCGRFASGHATDWGVPAERQVNLVLAGTVELTAGDGSTVRLQRGDVYLEDDLTGQGHRTTFHGECRVMQFGVLNPWEASDDRPATVDDPANPARPAHLRRMTTAADEEESYFRDFPELFAAPVGNWTPNKPVRGFRFCSFVPGFFIDWHPEAGNQLVVTLAGTLELEVGSGHSKVELFHAGDVCLAEDVIGRGHIDRMHGLTVLAISLVEPEHLW